MSTIKRGILLLLSTICLVQVHSGETTYFLVGEPPGRDLCRDSYVLPLSKQEDIDHARYLISLGRSVSRIPAKWRLWGPGLVREKMVSTGITSIRNLRNGPGM